MIAVEGTIKTISLIRLINLTSHVTALTVAEIKGRQRQRRFIRARMAVVHFACAAGYSTPRIGAALGGRDHSTILNLRDKSYEWLGHDPLFDRIMDSLHEAIIEGKANREVVPFVLPKPKVEPTDSIDVADIVARHRMKVASDKLLQALREAA